jgi:hypothetical protein
VLPSQADQFNATLQRHRTDSARSVNAWGLNRHGVNVVWSDPGGLCDNWDQAIAFPCHVADGVAGGLACEPKPELVQFVTVQELSDVYGALVQTGFRSALGAIAQFLLTPFDFARPWSDLYPSERWCIMHLTSPPCLHLPG